MPQRRRTAEPNGAAGHASEQLAADIGSGPVSTLAGTAPELLHATSAQGQRLPPYGVWVFKLAGNEKRTR